jgi:hypothetical protein|tara:strand:- start:541 stop:1020 length:480 start_codon:yes stop_codon:yes gene_type:complete
MKEDTKSKSKREVTCIEIIWEKKSDVLELPNTEVFTNFILEESYEAIKSALEEDLETVELFNIQNLSIVVELKKSQFSSVLEKIKEMYVDQEDYEECTKIQNLIDGKMKTWKYFSKSDSKKETIQILKALNKKEAYIAASRIKGLDLPSFKKLFKIEKL